MTPTIYELDEHGEATTAHHYCSDVCRRSALNACAWAAAVASVDEPRADIADGEVCDWCENELGE